MENKIFRFYEFGDFVLDAKRRVLFKSGKEIPLKPRQFELLFLLVQNEGRLLEHDELLDKVWEGLFVEQSSLKKGISALRQILEEKPNQSFYIKTIPRRGYSFVASVKPIADGENITVERYSVMEIEEIEEEIFIDDEISEKSVKLLPAPKQLNNLWLIMSFALVLIVVAAFFGWKYFSKRATAIDFSRMQIVPLTNSGNATFGIVSRNGENLLFPTVEKSLTAISVKNLSTGEVKQLLKPQKISIYSADFSPDGEAVFLWLYDGENTSRSGVYKILIAGGEPQKITDKQVGFLFSPDGKRVSYVRTNINEQGDSGIFTANPDASDEKLVFSYNPNRLFVLSFEWSPDGRFVTFAARSIKDNQKEFFISQIPSEGGVEKIIVPPRPQPIFSASWFPDQKGLAVTALDETTKVYQIWYVDVENGEWRRITNDLTQYSKAKVSADGKSIIVSQQRDVFNLWIGDGDGKNFRQITSDTINYQPDCSLISDDTVLYVANTNGNFEIWSMSAEGTNRKQLTFDAKNDFTPRASIDGRNIFFLSNRSGIYQVWQMDTDGANPKQITNASSDVRDFKLLPDGQTLIYQLWLAGQQSVLFKKPIDGEGFTQLKFTDPFAFDISPDGKFIAHAARTEKGVKIRLSHLDENKIFKEFDFGNFDNFVWSKDGKALIFDSYHNDRDEILIQPIEGGASKPLTNFNSDENIWNFDISPSGKRIVLRRAKQFFDITQIKLSGQSD